MSAATTIWQRVEQVAREAEVSADFVLEMLNYRWLVNKYPTWDMPLNCRHQVQDQDDCDIHFVFIEPPEHKEDWERLHVKNVYLMCGECRRIKGDMSFEDWVDEMWRRDQERAQVH